MNRSEAAVQLEHREMLAVIAVLLDRLGGEADIVGEELEAVRRGGWEVVSVPSMLKYSLGLRLRRPGPEIAASTQSAIEAPRRG